MTEKQKHKEEWKNQLEKEKQIVKEFKTIKNKWVKNWEFLVWEDKQMGLSTCLDEELNDTYKLRSSYENKNHFCDEENCRNQWRHFVKCESLDSFFHLCDYHVKKFGDKMFNILQNVKKENGNKLIFCD